jgi:excisionase family DNA binding protein
MRWIGYDHFDDECQRSADKSSKANCVSSFAANVHIPLSEYRPERLLDSAEAAAILAIHVKTFQRMARTGQIRGVRVGKLWRFRSSEIDMWIERNLVS